MIRYVQLDKKFVKQLKRLHKAGGKSRSAAEHAESIIQEWVSGEVKNPNRLTRGTRYGEARIKNCLKYDLVHAYRLLAVADGDQLCFLFVGPHNECDQWISHNSGWAQGMEEPGDGPRYVRADKPGVVVEESEVETEDDYLLEPIDEKDLRLVFAGICRSGSKGDNVHASRSEAE